MPVLITGNRGYIGSQFVKQVDCTAYFPCDLKSGDDFQSITGRDFDAVIHLAASVSVLESFRKQDEYLLNNCWKVLRFLKNNRVKKFIFTSTGGALYGNAHQAKEYQAYWPNLQSPYAQSKYLAEQVIRELCPNHVILRLANVYGGDYSVRGEASVHSHFQEDNPITVFGGDQTRDFVPIDTVCRALNKALTGDIRGTFNIGSGVETKVMDIARELSRSRNVPVSIQPARQGEIDYISLDITRAKESGLLE